MGWFLPHIYSSCPLLPDCYIGQHALPRSHFQWHSFHLQLGTSNVEFITTSPNAFNRDRTAGPQGFDPFNTFVTPSSANLCHSFLALLFARKLLSAGAGYSFIKAFSLGVAETKDLEIVRGFSSFCTTPMQSQEYSIPVGNSVLSSSVN